MNERFWMVRVDGAGVPTMKYGDKTEAITEANRLCVKEHKRAYVLETIGFYAPPDPKPIVPVWALCEGDKEVNVEVADVER